MFGHVPGTIIGLLIGFVAFIAPIRHQTGSSYSSRTWGSQHLLHRND